MIQEYRKASAEALELKWEFSWWYKMPNGKSILWKPDQNAEQREMIEDWLIEQGYEIKYWIYKNMTQCKIYKGYRFVSWYEDKSKSTAFMKAFMEYIKQKP